MKTAVEWLVNELRNGKEFNDELIDKAKEIEKEQSIELIRQTAMFMAAADFDEDIAKMTFEDIYETLKQEKQ
jgi:TRAP-type uncharacterized transport system substrate-binding protein